MTIKTNFVKCEPRRESELPPMRDRESEYVEGTEDRQGSIDELHGEKNDNDIAKITPV